MTASTKRFLALWVAPAALVLAVAIVPLAAGARTLVMRDVLNTHLPLRTYLAEAYRHGILPVIDPLRAGGQGLLGNPNALPFYPDNLLLLVGSTLWQLNAHFWLHWIVALAAAFALGRAWGLERRAAMGVGVVYAFSGYLLSQMNLYNAVAGAALAPALAATLLAAGAAGSARRRRAALALFGLVWALELLAGDPVLAAISLAAAVGLALARGGRTPWRGALLALALGTLTAAPQLAESLRLLPGTYRGFWGYEAGQQGTASPTPPALVELLLPLFFSRPALGEDWANGYFGGYPALYFSLAPSIVGLALAAVGARRGGRRAWGLLIFVALGLVAAFSSGAVGTLLGRLPGGSLFRYPVKLVLPGMLGFALLAGAGLERALAAPEAARRLTRTLAILAGVELVLLAVVAVRGNLLQAGFRHLFARGLDDAAFAAHTRFWAGVAAAQVAIAAAGALLARAMARGRELAGAALLALAAAGQLALLSGILPTDAAAPYRRRPALLDRIPAAAVAVHGGADELFGRNAFEVGMPAGAGLAGRERIGHDELFAASGLAAGRRFEFDISPEGMDSFMTQSIALALRNYSDRWRLQVLRATGVDRLILDRPLAEDAADALAVERVALARPVWIYRLDRSLPEAALLGRVADAPNINRAIERVLRPEFDPRVEAVVAGTGVARDGPPGRALVVGRTAETETLDADSPAGGALVVRRTWLPIWRATIDGRPARPVVANLTRLAVVLPPGRHLVRFSVDRRPLPFELAAGALGLLGLAALAIPWRRRAA